MSETSTAYKARLLDMAREAEFKAGNDGKVAVALMIRATIESRSRARDYAKSAASYALDAQAMRYAVNELERIENTLVNLLKAKVASIDQSRVLGKLKRAGI